MILTKNSQPIIFYHGTNRKFTEHSLEKSRTELNDRFQGDWICYTPSEEVAWKYTYAARNQCLDRNTFLQETQNYFEQHFPNKMFNQVLINAFITLMDNPFDNAWDTIFENYANLYNINPQEATIDFFKNIEKYKQYQENFDINDFCDALEYIEYSKYGQIDETNLVLNMFNNSIGEIPEYIIQFLKERNYQDSLPEPKIIKSFIDASSILKTESKEEAKKAQEKGYDLVIYSGEDCVDNIPEYLIASPSQIKMQSITIAHKKTEYLNEYKTEWIDSFSYENIDLKRPNKNTKRKKISP